MSVQNPIAPGSENVNDHIKGIYDILSGKQAPAQIGKPIWEKDIEVAKAHGVRTMGDLFGHRDDQDNKQSVRSINFGSKADCRFMGDDVRLRLFNLKRLLSDCEIQAGYIFKTGMPSATQIMETPLYRNYLEPTLKAFNITDFSQWLPTVHSRWYFEEYEIPYLLANEFDTLPMDSSIVHIPGVLGLLEGKEETDVATFTEQANTQSSFDVYARNNVVHTTITEDLSMDSAPAVIDKLRREVVAGNARAYERAVINGDITGSPRGASHMDSDIAAISKHFCKAFNGLRKRAMDNSLTVDHKGDSPSKALFLNMLKKMGKFGSEKSDLLWVYPSSVGTDLVGGAIPELFTAFAFGGLASNVTGAVPPVFGIKGIESQYVREDLDATGVYGSGQTKTNLLLVKKSRFYNFARAAIRVWASPSLPSSDIMLMTSKIRHAFAGVPQTSLEKSVVCGINIETVA